MIMGTSALTRKRGSVIHLLNVGPTHLGVNVDVDGYVAGGAFTSTVISRLMLPGLPGSIVKASGPLYPAVGL
jgi:hypothetical protein